MNRRAFLHAALASSVSASAEAQPAPAPGARFAGAASYSAARGGASFLVARHGIVLAEDYPQGDADSRWPLGAGTRSTAALLAASLVEDELMSLDEPVAFTLSEWAGHPIKSQVSVRALLNGTSGVAFAAGRSGGPFEAIALEPAAGLGERFSDDAAPYVLLAEIAHRKLVMAGRTPDPAYYVTERTLAPIGATPIDWTRLSDGSPMLHDGAAVSARAWAQIGELIRREGVWRAEQLADAGAMREALRGTFAESRAGIGFWLAAPTRPGHAPLALESDLWRGASGAPEDLAMAAGDGGQRLYLIPTMGAVIVRQSRTLDPDADWSDAEFLALVLRDA